MAAQKVSHVQVEFPFRFCRCYSTHSIVGQNGCARQRLEAWILLHFSPGRRGRNDGAHHHFIMAAEITPVSHGYVRSAISSDSIYAAEIRC
jgi:hypothetical protein